MKDETQTPADVLAARRELCDAMHAMHPDPDAIIIDAERAHRLEKAWDAYDAAVRADVPSDERLLALPHAELAAADDANLCARCGNGVSVDPECDFDKGVDVCNDCAQEMVAAFRAAALRARPAEGRGGTAETTVGEAFKAAADIEAATPITAEAPTGRGGLVEPTPAEARGMREIHARVTGRPAEGRGGTAEKAETVCNAMRTLIGRVCLRDRRGTIFSPDLIDEMTDAMAEAVRLLESRPAPSSPAQAEPRAGDAAMRAAMNVCHDLHEGHIPGTGDFRLSLSDMRAAREHVAMIIRNELSPAPPAAGSGTPAESPPAAEAEGLAEAVNALRDAHRLCADLVDIWERASAKPADQHAANFTRNYADLLLDRVCSVGNTCEAAAAALAPSLPRAGNELPPG